ncbi:hypothetical protein GOBAR_DD27674 [Gossypium barbadense]|nr:hypothetical protein GOBAR_DD27674 [Gossypium barbadense]
MNFKKKGIEPPVVNIVLGTSLEGKSALGGDARVDDTIPPANPPQGQIWARELKELSVELKRMPLEIQDHRDKM